MNQFLKKSLLESVRKNQPHTNAVLGAINAVFNVGDTLAAQEQRLSADKNLSALGRQTAMAKVASDLLPDFVKASRPARVKPKELAAQRAALGLPVLDRLDLVGGLERQELRNYVRGLRSTSAKLEAVADPVIRAAVLGAPQKASGLPADIFSGLQADALEELHGAKFAELDAVASDFTAVSAAAEAVATDLARVSGIPAHSFGETLIAMCADADRVAEPVQVQASDDTGFKFDAAAFDASFDAEYARITGHPVPALSEKVEKH